jgi:hypothetical protein
MLLLGTAHDRNACILSSVDSARRAERRPQQQPEKRRGAERNRDLHPELDDRADDDQQHEGPAETATAAAALVIHGC